MSWGLAARGRDAQTHLTLKEGVECCFVPGCGHLCAVCHLLLADTSLRSAGVVKGLLRVSNH